MAYKWLWSDERVAAGWQGGRCLPGPKVVPGAIGVLGDAVLAARSGINRVGNSLLPTTHLLIGSNDANRSWLWFTVG
jgi:hypothetical protein